jgi:zinc transport system permease protein
MADFLLHATLAGLAIATIAGPLGAFVVWQRLAYFGDTLAHSALLGVAIGLGLAINTELAIIVCCLGLAGLLTALQRNPQLATDSLLGILSHGSLAVGLVAISLMDNARLDLNAYLFGDLLAVSTADLIGIAVVVSGLLLLLIIKWRALLAISVHPELAQVEGYAVERLRLLLMLMIALLVAISMKVIGVLLITALLIIPAACARRVSKSPEQMALLAAVAGWLSVTGGLTGSLFWDTPAGPSVVVCAVVLFAIVNLLGNLSAARNRAFIR